ncbi:MAG: hypothetical protein KDK35_18885 [Leptospiraceae bacterium]|nr:hypothetical protein [Leptospiraceae bacterium]
MKNSKHWRRAAWKPVPGPLALYARLNGNGHFEMMGRIRQPGDATLAAKVLEDFLNRELELQNLRNQTTREGDEKARPKARPQSRRPLQDVPALDAAEGPAEERSDRGAA